MAIVGDGRSGIFRADSLSEFGKWDQNMRKK